MQYSLAMLRIVRHIGFWLLSQKKNLVDVHTIIETKNVDFFENIFPMKLNGEQQVQKTSRDKSIEP